jgi:hypothetical protein
MLEILGLLCVGGVVLVIVGAVVAWFGKVFRNASESRRLNAWFKTHGTDFFDGVVSEDHPLYRPLATKLSYEPEPPGHISKGTLWWAGAGARAGREFRFVGHSPSHPNFPNTWRVFVECDTGLAEEEVLVLCAKSSAVFVDGPLAKKTLEGESPPPGWDWAEVASRGDGARSWLTPQRSRALQPLLKTGRALQVYPGFVVAILHGGGAVEFVEQCLDGLAPVLGAPVRAPVESVTAAEGPEASGEVDEHTLRQRVDWSPVGTQEWSEVRADSAGSRWMFRAKPDNIWKFGAAGMTAIGLVAGVLQHLQEGLGIIPIVIFSVLFIALNVFVWREGWDRGSVGVLDLAAQTWRTGKGQDWSAFDAVETHDLSTAKAVQLVHSVSRAHSEGDGQATKTVRALHAYIVCENGARIPLATFGREEFWDLKLQVARVPGVITDIRDASGWGLLEHL